MVDEKMFKDFTDSEVIQMVIDMCEKWNISGSTSTYNLYSAVQNERAKANMVPVPSEEM